MHEKLSAYSVYFYKNQVIVVLQIHGMKPTDCSSYLPDHIIPLQLIVVSYRGPDGKLFDND